MGIVDDLIGRQSALAKDRHQWEEHWYDVANYALPNVDRFDRLFDTGVGAVDRWAAGPKGAERSKNIYDTTSLWAVDRGVAGFMSLITPQSENWHGITGLDALTDDSDQQTDEWSEKFANYLHKMRNNPQTGFWISHKSALRAMWALGTGIQFVSENLQRGPSAPMSYRYVQLSESYLATNYEGIVDTNFRCFTKTAAQCVAKWGDKCSAETKNKAADAKKKDDRIDLMHVVVPRAERGSGLNTRRNAPWAEFYVETKAKTILFEGGYNAFPYVVYHWNQMGNDAYSEGPMALALAEVKSLNSLSKDALRASQQAVNPPTASIDDGFGRVNLNPGKNNPGLVSAEGRLLVQPIVTAPRPDFAESILNIKREQIKESLYVNLWQLLINSPEMTATEALIRAEEKGQLLGPAAASLYTGIARLVDVETQYLVEQGAFEPDKPLALPESMQGKDIAVQMDTPLDRMRRSGEVTGMQRTLEFGATLAQLKNDPKILDKFDDEHMLDTARKVFGAPASMFKTDEELKKAREATEQMQQMMQTLQAAQAGGEAAKAVGEGAQAVEGSAALTGALAQ
jgi:hypothetical protein